MTSHASSTNPRATPPSLLILVLDIHPLSWSLLSTFTTEDRADDDDDIAMLLPDAPGPSTTPVTKVPIAPVSLSEFINILLIFLNSHLASRWGNRVVVFAASAGRSRLLYPVADQEERANDGQGPNVYHPFGLLDKGLEAGLKGMIAEEEANLDDTDGEGLNEPPAIVSAMTKALCYINRHSPPPAAESTAVANETRILVINATPGAGSNSAGADSGAKSGGGGGMRGGYVGLMNCVFAAQKAKIPIDVLTLPPPSTGTEAPIFLQQASHLTEGVYWRWNGRGGLLQYLHTIYLRPPSLRQNPFSNPPQDAVDFRAVCFCHHDVADIGFVCSVCLSIFCKPLPVCQMCKTKFPMKSLPQLKSLAGNVISIPLPQTIPPPPVKKDKKRKADTEVIVID